MSRLDPRKRRTRASAVQKQPRTVSVFSRHPTHSILRRNPELRTGRLKVMLRLGSTTERNEKAYDVVINPASAIRNSSDKLLMKECFEKAKVQHCTWWKGAAIRNANPNFPIIAKGRFGSRGRLNTKLDSQEELNNFLRKNSNLGNYIFEEFFNSSKEYRLHVSKDGCFYSCRKLRRRDTADDKKWFFNNENCVWITQYKMNRTKNGFTTTRAGKPILKAQFEQPHTWKEIEADCVKALKSVGLDFGAFDVRVSKDGQWKIIEVNSAPSFGDMTSVLYINEIKKIINANSK